MKVFKLTKLVLIAVSFFACGREKSTRRYDGFLVESNWLNDTIPDGKSTFYNEDGAIVSIQYFSKGLRNGWTTYFDSKGRLTDSIFYFNGLMNGYYYKVDTNGYVFHKGYYMRGFSFGPQYWYRQGVLSEYVYSTFEQVIPFKCTYNGDSLKIEGKPFFVNTYELTKEDTTNCLGIFAYLAHAPKIHCDYSLLQKDSLQKEYVVIRNYLESEILIDTFLVLKKGTKYYLRTIFRDSVNDYSHVYFSEL